jgi:hypothetical protein
MSTKTKTFLALTLIGKIGVVRGTLNDLSMEKLKLAAQELLDDSRGGGFVALYSLFESVSRCQPTLGSDVVRNVLERALDVAEMELEKEVGR